MMLQKQYRLRKRYDFKRTYQRGKSVKNRNFVICYAKNHSDSVKIGFSVSKKIGKAVERNRVKRKLRAAARAQLESFRPGYNYIIIARPPIKEESVEKLERQLKARLAEAFADKEQKKTDQKKEN
jgi:ribonuclease P protein component